MCVKFQHTSVKKSAVDIGDRAASRAAQGWPGRTSGRWIRCSLCERVNSSASAEVRGAGSSGRLGPGDGTTVGTHGLMAGKQDGIRQYTIETSVAVEVKLADQRWSRSSARMGHRAATPSMEYTTNYHVEDESPTRREQRHSQKPAQRGSPWADMRDKVMGHAW